MFISGLNPDIIQVLKKSSQELNQDIHQFAANVLCTIFPERSVEKVKIFADCARLSLAEEGMNFIAKYSKSHNILRQNVLNHMFTLKGFSNA